MSTLFIGSGSEDAARAMSKDVGAHELDATPESVRDLANEADKTITIYNIDALSATVQNALLKSIEEGNRYILSATGYVLPTIRSRCKVTRLPYIPSGIQYDYAKLLDKDFQEARESFLETALREGRYADAFKAIFAKDHTGLTHETTNHSRRRTFFDKKANR